ncbi:ABC transporter ATP-binding protein [Weissella confusa]|uniref:ABC transporter ATP-binding protein n=1 Tax=Weissella confusa TaxID=1583 RepID=UPI0018F24B8A|nr:ABC transporter ATP-binding protein [Weissella confusa]MBJ7617944.1 ABC transporter ATP-binding protein [Weissella confusa]MBJ7625222.1 ABC transporter ATP-binding protein [Weissella confusa]MBJ7651456.1 ABC transporter ATP-binding protein [Weissella confusa]MBJ7658303.1 ABC transporter ATP-binding protein [Weissella confusa]MBJ7665897.1 ABC transporter ATP-binding protein [Weissella confusa]
MRDEVLVVKDLQKRFGKFQALKNVSFEVREGEVFGFLGPNGAGKSTTIRTILGLLHKDGGEIKLLGEDATKNVVNVHKQLAYVPGDVFLWPNLTGGEIIDLLLKMGGHQRTDKVNALIKKFELDPKKKAHTYSKGNRQKVALIAAFATDVPFYIFDEPTSGLDPLQERNFQEEVMALKAAGKTILLSSHISSEVEKMVDRVAIIRKGRIVETGALSDMQGRAELNVRAAVSNPAVLSEFEGFERDGDEVAFTVARDDLATMMTQLNAAGVTDLKVTPPTLEDLFMQYYDAEGEQNG